MLSRYAPLPIWLAFGLRSRSSRRRSLSRRGDRVQMGRCRWRGAFLRSAGGRRGEGHHLPGLDLTAAPPAPQRASSRRSDKPKTTAFADAQVTIVSPAQDQTFSGGEAVTASLRSSRRQVGPSVLDQLDTERLARGRGCRFAVVHAARGPDRRSRELYPGRHGDGPGFGPIEERRTRDLQPATTEFAVAPAQITPSPFGPPRTPLGR